MPTNPSPRTDLAITALTPARTLDMLLAELVELGRNAWRISERERAVRAEINALYEADENYTLEQNYAA
jgi:hypothetical protein